MNEQIPLGIISSRCYDIFASQLSLSLFPFISFSQWNLLINFHMYRYDVKWIRL